MMCDASEMLAAALEQMDGIIAGTTKSAVVLFADLHSHRLCDNVYKKQCT